MTCNDSGYQAIQFDRYFLLTFFYLNEVAKPFKNFFIHFLILLVKHTSQLLLMIVLDVLFVSLSALSQTVLVWYLEPLLLGSTEESLLKPKSFNYRMGMFVYLFFYLLVIFIVNPVNIVIQFSIFYVYLCYCKLDLNKF